MKTSRLTRINEINAKIDTLKAERDEANVRNNQRQVAYLTKDIASLEQLRTGYEIELYEQFGVTV